MKNKFAADNEPMLLIDYPVGIMGWVRSIPFEDMKRNAQILANPGKILTLILFLCASRLRTFWTDGSSSTTRILFVRLADCGWHLVSSDDLESKTIVVVGVPIAEFSLSTDSPGMKQQPVRADQESELGLVGSPRLLVIPQVVAASPI